jgi:signal transduction histidine kinase
MPRRRRKTAWGIAFIAPVVVTLTERRFASFGAPAGTLFVILFVVVVAALLGGTGPALTAVVVGLVAQEVLFSFPYGSLIDQKPAQISVLLLSVVIGGGIGILVDELIRLTTEQAALHRIATLVARGTPPGELFTAVAGEVASLLVADSAIVGHVEPDGLVTILAQRGRGAGVIVVGERREVRPHTAVAMVAASSEPARTDDDEHASPETRTLMRQDGVRSDVATPIVVDGRLRGVIEASSSRARFPTDSVSRMLNFTELVATAIANAESGSQLAASRARIVAAEDEARRRLERDLHDGVQQRLVSLALEVRAAQAAVPPTQAVLRDELASVVEGLTGALDELREISRGIHPAILPEGGLGPALRTLARRAPVPVALSVHVDDELPDGVEVAAYYTVSEIVTNAAKHAQASLIEVDVSCADGVLGIVARDDGIGGADPTAGSGLIGLQDRIAALGGTCSVHSPKGEGTAVHVVLPLRGDHQ